MSLPDWVGPVQRGRTHGSPTNPLLLVGFGENAPRGLPAAKAGLRPTASRTPGSRLGRAERAGHDLRRLEIALADEYLARSAGKHTAYLRVRA